MNVGPYNKRYCVVNPEVVCDITHHPFKLEPARKSQQTIIDLDLQGQI